MYKKIIKIICVILLFLTSSFIFIGSGNSSIAYQANTDQMEVLELINQEREKLDLLPLQLDKQLNKIAQKKAEDLIETQVFSHNSSNYGKVYDMLNYEHIKYKIAGENLAGNSDSKKAVQAWMASESHKENILEENYKYTGIYIIESQEYGKIFVQIFLG